MRTRNGLLQDFYKFLQTPLVSKIARIKSSVAFTSLADAAKVSLLLIPDKKHFSASDVLKEASFYDKNSSQASKLDYETKNVIKKERCSMLFAPGCVI